MRKLLLLLSVCYSLGSVAQESYPLQAIERTSFYAEPVDPPTETALPSGNIAARDGGGNTVGLTTGELSVSGTGAAVYTVPIAVPQGIKGVAPTLALTYNSQSGNGIAGYGWHLAGLSVISRVGSTMYHNDKITEVNLTETDQFALDGQRLMLKEGKHGESGAVYETETFSQVRIKAVGKSKNVAFGPDYFEVLYPDGSKAYYGRNHKGNRSQSVLEYALSHWENAQGVSIEYYYTIENNHMVISRIEYGGKDNALHTVSFKYIARNRTESAYVGGVACINDKILSAITVTDNNTSY
ncbi:MAG: SpvB/TcaC N-terminal domain-containing protein, partial [Capnocytophaga ochracea]